MRRRTPDAHAVRARAARDRPRRVRGDDRARPRAQPGAGERDLAGGRRQLPERRPGGLRGRLLLTRGLSAHPRPGGHPGLRDRDGARAGTRWVGRVWGVQRSEHPPPPQRRPRAHDGAARTHHPRVKGRRSGWARPSSSTPCATPPIRAGWRSRMWSARAASSASCWRAAETDSPPARPTGPAALPRRRAYARPAARARRRSWCRGPGGRPASCWPGSVRGRRWRAPGSARGSPA